MEDLGGELVGLWGWWCRLGLELLLLLWLLQGRLLLGGCWLLLRGFGMKRSCLVTGSRRLLRHGAMQGWRCEDGMLVEEGVRLRRHRRSRMSIEVWRSR